MSHSFSTEPRLEFTWPGLLESNCSSSTVLNNTLSLMGHGLSPTSLGMRSFTSSSRFSFNMEQRDSKRQQYRASPDTSSTMSLLACATTADPMCDVTEPATTISLLSYPPYSLEEPCMQTTPSLLMNDTAVHASPGYYNYPSPISLGLIYQVPAIMSRGVNSRKRKRGEVVQSRPKPQCWEHGCNGRQFSTMSNLLRHQREQSGQAAKVPCPNCGEYFTRTTARNVHLDKCKGRKTQGDFHLEKST